MKDSPANSVGATVMLLSLSVALLGMATSARADFSGLYDPTNWRFYTTGPGGSVDTSAAPASITLIGPDEPLGGPLVDMYAWYLIPSKGDGMFAFDWLYTCEDSDPTCDAGYYVNHSMYFLSETSGDSGSVSVPVQAGDMIGWLIISYNSILGPGVLTVTEFSAPVPEPASLSLLAIATGLSLLSLRCRRRASANTLKAEILRTRVGT